MQRASVTTTERPAGGVGEWEEGVCVGGGSQGHSLSLVGRGFFSFVSVFFSFVLSKREISVRSGLSDILAVDNTDKRPLSY